MIGAAGFLGRSVLSAVGDAGGQASGLDHNPAPAGTPAGISWTTAEAADIAAVGRAIAGTTDVVFLAGRSRPSGGYTSLASEIDAEVTQALAVAEACSAAGVSRFVFASSGGTVYGNDVRIPSDENQPTRPLSPYGLSKLVVEHGLRLLSTRDGMATTVLRISNPYGPGQRVKRQQGIVAAAMQALMTGQPLEIWGDGTIVRDFVYIDDVARSFVAAIADTRRHLLVNIGSGQPTSILDLCQSIENVTNKRLRRTFLENRPVDLPAAVLDITQARKSLGWAPDVALQDGLKMTFDWWTERPDQP